MRISDEDWYALVAVVEDPARPGHHVLRARMVLLGMEGRAPGEIARELGSSHIVVRRWIKRYADDGLRGITRDPVYHPGRPSIPADVVEEIQRLSRSKPPDGAATWSGRAMAKAVGISARSVHRIWRAHGLPED